MIRVLILKSGVPHQSKAPSSSSGVIRVLILKPRAPHQSKAPSSEFRGDKSSDFKIRGAPSVRLHPRSSDLKSGAPHQSKAPSSEFRGDKSSDFKIRGAPSVQGSILGVQG